MTIDSNAASDNSGAANRRLYLDAVDEALNSPKRVGPGAPKGPRKPRRQVNDIAIRQLKAVERQRRALAQQLSPTEPRCDACGKPATHGPEALAALVRASSDVSDQIVKLSQSVRLGYEAERKAFEGLTEDQLDVVFRDQLRRVAAVLDTETKRMLLVTWFGQDVADVLLKPRVTRSEEVTPPIERAD